ncbi:MAG: TIGR02221 family CRISPR-associated protein, partial [Pseudoleptotrichia goodfellowii]|nr:TIGR02221 family CRISPR-associated protein [Pseudoleptotrichia goodfellowii]
MAKILIAGIGGGKKDNGSYKVANYSIKDEKTGEIEIYENEKFVTSAIEKYYKIDKTIYIGTVGSMWDSLYSYYCDKYKIEKDSNYEIELYNVSSVAKKEDNISVLNIEKFNKIFEGKVEARITKYGINTKEIFENFNIIMYLQDVLNDGDEIFIDITHSFRSNAMWMFLVLSYITDVLDKKIDVRAITYGMFEASNYEGITPIVNLKAFYDLMKWIKGASEFKNYGNSYTFLDMIENKNITENVKKFSDAVNLNYVGSIMENISRIKEIMEDVERIEGPGQILIPEIVKDFVKRFENTKRESEVLLKLAEWYMENKRYAMVAININESIKSYIKEIFEIKDKNKNVIKITSYFENIKMIKSDEFTQYFENMERSKSESFYEKEKIEKQLS